MNALEIAEKFAPYGFEVSRVDAYGNPLTMQKIVDEVYIHMAVRTEQQNIVLTVKLFKKYELRRSFMATVDDAEFTKALRYLLEMRNVLYGKS